jgi:hypothetical protein
LVQDPHIAGIAKALRRTEAEVSADARVYEGLKDPAQFAEVLFSKGEGWLHAGLPLAQFQMDGLDLLEKKHEKTLLLWPRGHLKTTLLKIWTLHQILYGHAKYVVFLTSTDKNKRGHALAHRSVLQDAHMFPEFHWLLPYWFNGQNPIVKANENELVLSNGTRIEYLSIGGEIRGLNAAGRPDLIVLDDILPSEAATSDAERERVTNVWFSVIRFLGAAGARFVGVGTILHKQDLWCQIADGNIGGWEVKRLRACNDDFTNILWPERWTSQALKDVYEKEYVKAGRAHLFAREMFNDPATGATHPFGNVVFKHAKPPLWSDCYRVISIDHSSGTGGDDFAICETGEDSDGIVYPFEMFLSNQITLPQKLMAVEGFIRRRRPHKLVCGRTSESMTFIEVLIDHLKQRQLYSGYFIETPSETAEKNERIRAWLEARYTSGAIVHPIVGPEWLRKHEGAMRSFDVTTQRNYDDSLDVLARCCEYSKPATRRIQGDTRPSDPVAAKFWDAMHGRIKDTADDGLNTG